MASQPSNHREIASLFAKLGFLGFGGPAAHIAMMEDEVVTRRGWMTRQSFLDLVGATNIIPGPNSTEMAIHLGYIRGGWRGMLIAGGCFILPAAFMMALLAILYVNYGTLPEVEPWIYGTKPAVIAVILGALYKLAGKAIKGPLLGALAVACVAASLAGAPELYVLFGGAAVGVLLLRARDMKANAAAFLPPLMLGQSDALAATTVTATWWKLGLFFLKVGSILYGSGYVLIAFLEDELVARWQWLTQTQLLDAVAMGQVTPGPVFTTATFVGYVVLAEPGSVSLSGLAGAAASTVGIFLPSFVFVVLLNRVLPKLRSNAWLSAFLDAVNAVAVALMAAVVIELAWVTLMGGRWDADVARYWPAWVIAALSAVAVVRFQINAAWIVIAAALIGRGLLALA